MLISDRHVIYFLLSFSIILFVRMCFELFYLLKRKFGWSELGGVLFALFLYQVVFAALGARSSSTLNIIDFAAIPVFLGGSALNTVSEVQRKTFKDQPENKGKLYTQGLFWYARHINYFGDVLWVTAWAVVTRNIFAAAIPVFITVLFVFAFIPSLSQHLRIRYGDQYEAWAAHTKALIPFVY